MERQECAVYTRTVGWFSHTGSFNPGKLSEWKDRKVYDFNTSMNHETKSTDN